MASSCFQYVSWGCLVVLLLINNSLIATAAAEGVVNQKDIESSHTTALEKHVAFFDRNRDGFIDPIETYQGFRAIGSGRMLSTLSAIFINGLLGPKTRHGFIPPLSFTIEVKNIPMAKHGSDSGVFDARGRFVRAKFDEMFEKYARTRPDALSYEELITMLKSNREPRDYAGWVKSLSEWMVLYKLCKENDGFIGRDIIIGIYDGTLFYQMETNKQCRIQGVVAKDLPV